MRSMRQPHKTDIPSYLNPITFCFYWNKAIKDTSLWPPLYEIHTVLWWYTLCICPFHVASACPTTCKQDIIQKNGSMQCTALSKQKDKAMITVNSYVKPQVWTCCFWNMQADRQTLITRLCKMCTSICNGQSYFRVMAMVRVSNS